MYLLVTCILKAISAALALIVDLTSMNQYKMLEKDDLIQPTIVYLSLLVFV